MERKKSSEKHDVFQKQEDCFRRTANRDCKTVRPGNGNGRRQTNTSPETCERSCALPAATPGPDPPETILRIPASTSRRWNRRSRKAYIQQFMYETFDPMYYRRFDSSKLCLRALGDKFQHKSCIKIAFIFFEKQARCTIFMKQVVNILDARERIQQLLEERNWTIYRLSKESDLSQTTSSNIFKRNNEPSIPTLKMLKWICGAFCISISHF